MANREKQKALGAFRRFQGDVGTRDGLLQLRVAEHAVQKGLLVRAAEEQRPGAFIPGA